jgi:hypothetical protein
MSYDISISLLKNNFCKLSREGELIYFSRESRWSIKLSTSLYKSRSITHDQLISFGSTLQVLLTIAVPRQYPPSTLPDTFLHFLKAFMKTKPILGWIATIPTVHDRRLGYSNRFTLCRGCTLYPQDLINPPGYHHGPSYISMRGSDNRTESSIYLP